MPFREEKVWTATVTRLNQYVRESLRADSMLRSVILTGEVSGFKPYRGGQWYFDLKDETSVINCVMFGEGVRSASFMPRNGDQVRLHGRVDLYLASGRYQFVADSIRPDGVGTLYQRFEALKAKLQAEGLFESSRKQQLPWRPQKIAVVTSEAGAVLRDIVKVSRARDPGVPLVLVSVPVQGAAAAPVIAEGIRKAGRIPGVDVIITGRGGGSMEDLWCFNEECVARAIAESPVPVVSAVGHETDFTIADMVADVRASTPSNAAELAVPDRSDALEGLRMIRQRMTRAALGSIQEAKYALAGCRARMEAQSPVHRLRVLEENMRRLRARMDGAAERAIGQRQPQTALLRVRMDAAIDQRLRHEQQRVAGDRARLQALNPLAVLERGYALVTDGNRVVTRAADAPDTMRLRFSDGSIDVQKMQRAQSGAEGLREKTPGKDET